MRKPLAALAVTVLAVAGCSSYGSRAGAPPTRVVDGGLTNSAGMTLNSACNGPCAANWPPLLAGADARPSGDYTIIIQDDSARQWAYNGKIKDNKPGDRTGEGFNDAWRLARG